MFTQGITRYVEKNVDERFTQVSFVDGGLAVTGNPDDRLIGYVDFAMAVRDHRISGKPYKH